MADGAMGSKLNFLIITADDLGFSDLSCYGSEIHTPHIDSLAISGTRFTDFHVAAASAPSRAMLMTGTDHHLTGHGQTVEHLINTTAYRGKPGHEGHLTDHVATLPEVLRDRAGYYTVMSGKWNLGVELEHSPQARGFDRSFALLAPAANHFAWEPEIPDEDESEKLPPFARLNVTALHAEDGEYIDNEKLPQTFYSSDFYADKLMDHLDARPYEHQPFFAYLSFSAPRWPLQCPKEDAAQYRGVYDDGPLALRTKRLAKMQKLGIIGKDVKPHPLTAPEVPKWGDLSLQQRARSARAMEVYAGMVARMDYNVGRVLSYLKYRGVFESTQVLFLSASAADGSSYDSQALGGKGLSRYLAKYYDNSLANIGRANSFVWYGGRWAQAVTAPFRLYNRYSTEGGTRVPLILKPAAGIPFDKSICHHFCTIQDVMPTLLEQAGIPTLQAKYGDRHIHPIRGTSLLPFLLGEASRPHPPDHVTGWELFGQAGLRKGAWKLSLVNLPLGAEKWELYNLDSDPGETSDLAWQKPGKVQELLAEWRRYAEEVGVVGLTPQLKNRPIEMRDAMEEMGEWVGFATSRGVAERERRRRDRLALQPAAFDSDAEELVIV